MAWEFETDLVKDMIGDASPANITLRLKKKTYNLYTKENSYISTDYIIEGIITNYAIAETDNKNIFANDIKILLPAKNLPELQDENEIYLISNGVSWKVVSFKTLSPGGVHLLYTFQCRRYKKVED